MIKIGIAIDAGWIGGVNYYRNLLLATSKIPERKIEFVIFIGHKTSPKILEGIPNFKIIKTKILDRWTIQWLANKIATKIFQNNLILNRLLKKENIELLTHVTPYKNDGLKKIGWIPDFQHLRLPEYFSPSDIEVRNNDFEKIAKYCNAVILSSRDAYRDFEKQYPDYSQKGIVLNFVPTLNMNECLSFDLLREKYSLHEEYFFLPNQFWKHKNHIVVIRALIEAKKNNSKIMVVSTGSKVDNRDFQYYENLKNIVKLGDIEKNFKELGIVPYVDVIGLMRNSLAVINPSLFEGWSTTVEEAKAMGLPMILSRIPVHEEQAGKLAYYFEPNDSEELAKILINFENQEISNKFEYEKINSKKIINFGQKYQSIVLKVMNDG